jgi:queuine tRNA-ribosyltransferase
MLGQMLLSEINLAYYQQLMAGMRAAIGAGRFDEFRAGTRAAWEQGDLPALSG